MFRGQVGARLPCLGRAGEMLHGSGRGERHVVDVIVEGGPVVLPFNGGDVGVLRLERVELSAKCVLSSVDALTFEPRRRP